MIYCWTFFALKFIIQVLMTVLIKVSSESITFHIFRQLRSLRQLLFYFNYCLFGRKLGCQCLRLVFVEAFYQRGEINGRLKSCHDHSRYNIYDRHETSRVRYNSEECCYSTCRLLMGFIHLYIDTDESISIAFIGRQILHYRIIYLGFYIIIFLFFPFK